MMEGPSRSAEASSGAKRSRSAVSSGAAGPFFRAQQLADRDPGLLDRELQLGDARREDAAGALD